MPRGLDPIEGKEVYVMPETVARLVAQTEFLDEASVTVGSFEERAWVPRDTADADE